MAKEGGTLYVHYLLPILLACTFRIASCAPNRSLELPHKLPTSPAMLDPLSALNVAAAAIQFVDVSYRGVTGIIAAYRSVDISGTQQAFHHLRSTAERLKSSNARLIISLNPDELHRSPTETESSVVSAATEAVHISGALLNALRELDVSEIDAQLQQPWYQRRVKLEAAVKAVWKKEELEALQQKLKDLRDQLSFIILLELR